MEEENQSENVTVASETGLDTSNNEEIVTMMDVLNEEQELEQTTQAVLGASDDQNCTYSQGYVKRQALYTCTTCEISGAEACAGICLACSLKCHENHNLVEMYTKRQFRCDCGNKKFNSKCLLVPSKDDFNVNNSYNQNFKGVYCTCSRPYPDPTDTVTDEQYQCVVCEDWYHTRHLLVEDKTCDLSEADEMTCHVCMEKYPFLRNYVALSIFAEKSEKSGKSDADNESSLVNVTDVTDDKVISSIDTQLETNAPVTNGSGSGSGDKSGDIVDKVTQNGDVCEPEQALDGENNKSAEIKNVQEESKHAQLPEASDNDTKATKPSAGECEQGNLASDAKVSESVACDPVVSEISKVSDGCKMPKITCDDSKHLAMFWRKNWRGNLCTCDACVKMYAGHKLEFLLDDEDTVAFYEAKGKNSVSVRTQYEAGMQALSTLDRVHQVNMISEYNDMKEQLKNYLQKFADSQQVVREDDIREFFSGMHARKRRRVDVPDSCR